MKNLKSIFIKYINSFVKYVNNFAVWKKILFILSTVLFIVFHYLLNSLPEVASDIFGYAFCLYLIGVTILFILKRDWLMTVIHICALLTALFSIFWFLFI